MSTPSAQASPEPVLDPGLPIVDAHHHLHDRPHHCYVVREFVADLQTGHDIRATVAVECGDMYRAKGPAELRCVGEAEFLAGIAAVFASGRYGPVAGCAAIVANADLRLGARVEPVLEALRVASGGRLRGIRRPAAYHPAKELQNPRAREAVGLLRDPAFREGIVALGRAGLSLDLWIYHTQLGDAVALARSCPDTTFVLDHFGGPLGKGEYAGRRDEVFAAWRTALAEVARCPNVVCKIGGFGMPILGFGFDGRVPRPSSLELAAAWRPYVETTLDLFGAQRCMFESNFPPDAVSCGYREVWNAFKRLTAACSPAERAALFSGTATRVYRLEDVMADVGGTA